MRHPDTQPCYYQMQPTSSRHTVSCLQGGVDRVEIFSKAQVIVDSVYTQDVANDFESVLTTALPDRQLEPARHRLDWWIYVVSAACGLLVLVLIVLVLWRLGFFERRRRPDGAEDDDTDFMMSANFEKVKLNGNSEF